MKIKDGFVLRDVAGQTVVIATGEASRDFQGMVKLNPTGRLIWQGVAASLTEKEIVAQLMDAFDVDAERAAADVRQFAEKMVAEGFLA